MVYDEPLQFLYAERRSTFADERYIVCPPHVNNG